MPEYNIFRKTSLKVFSESKLRGSFIMKTNNERNLCEPLTSWWPDIDASEML